MKKRFHRPSLFSWFFIFNLFLVVAIPINELAAKDLLPLDAAKTSLANLKMKQSTLPPEDIYLYPYSEQDTLEAGDQFCIEVRADGFVDIIGFQFSLNWNPDALHFDSVTGFNFPDMDIENFGIDSVLNNNGKLGVLWTFTTGVPTTFPDGTSLFEVCFTVLSSAEMVNIIQISGDPTAIEFVNFDEDILSVEPGSIDLYVPEADPELQIWGGQAAVDPGAQVCIPVKVIGFEVLKDLQFSMAWDTSQLKFNGLQTFNLPDLSISNFDLNAASLEGILSLVWADPSMQGVTQADSTAIFDICFLTTGSLEIASVDFTNNPVMINATNVNDQSAVITVSSGAITINGIPVWPGDTDLSEIVDHFDLLNIGLAYGENGPTRPNASLTWVEQAAALWAYTTPNSEINAAHIDTDGNGTIDDADVHALEQNWGETTNFWQDGDENRLTSLPEATTLADPMLIVEPQILNPGQEATFNILFGDETTPAEDVYGLAFTVVYDPVAVVSSSVSASFSDSWLGDENGELIKIFRDRPEDNRLDIAISRINQQNRDGQGAIAQINLTIAEILQEENYPMAFEIENPRIITSQEELITAGHPTTFSEILGTTATYNPELNRRFTLYPIPARDLLQLSMDDLKVDAIELLSPEGKVVQRWEQALTQIPISKLAPGTYILQLFTAEGMVQKRFVKL
ncbi:MAG: hypothetical protein DHS20C18_26510 [Saprospiraceae bacterium]|nr:MAG: hypothetical protein DHS20C18_26510 [Saprospiraceae bacterium]